MSPPNETHCTKLLKRSLFVVAVLMKYRTDYPPQFTKREVQPVLTAVAVQPAQDIGWQDRASADGDGYTQHVRQHGFNQVPVHLPGEQFVNMLIPGLWKRPEDMLVLPIANTRHQFHTEQVR
jgi:hypothetical protein